MTGPELYVVTGIVVAFFGLGWLLGFGLHSDPREPAPPPCPHNQTTTSFPMMKPLQDLFSGRISVEEYRKIPWQESVTRCGQCGEVLR